MAWRKVKRFVWMTLALTIVVILSLSVWIFQLNKEILASLANKQFLPPTEYFSSPESFYPGQRLSMMAIVEKLKSRNYREREPDLRLFPGDFTLQNKDICEKNLPSSVNNLNQCLLFVAKENDDPSLQNEEVQIVAFDDNQVLATFRGRPPQPAANAQLEPELVAQFLDKQPIMQNYVPLGQIPTQCLNAVLAIEDAHFLEHSGVSYIGIARAFLNNFFSSKGKQGGSTITQQMVKNYFLTSERTIKRKVTEILMSFILENHSSKDEILETYLNIIYLGQKGPFQIRGFAAASDYYFQKKIEQLELSECSLLAAVLNSPGLYDPFHKIENATKRRHLVLDRMKELQMISDSEYAVAAAAPLPKARSISVAETAPYYIHAVNKQVENLGLDPRGAKIFTGLDLSSQAAAQKSTSSFLADLEKNNIKIKKAKEEGQSIEGALLSADIQTGLVQAVVGGRSYRMTQFNRAIDGHRQVGSIMKPIVFLTALQKEDFNPTTVLTDARFNYKYENQSWSPENYGKKYFGQVPMYFALKNSLNTATANLGLQIGLEQIIETAKKLGVSSKLEKVPALTLGAFELYPMEVLEVYTTLARMGNHVNLSFVRAMKDQNKNILFQFQPESEQRLEASTVASLISMMKQTLLSGTAKVTQQLGFTLPAAGKTGTTSDNKDAWFAGFTPLKATVVWIGYDNNTPLGLTGATGAVPIWTDYMKSVTATDPIVDFNWPEDSEVKNIKSFDPEEKNENSIELVFKK